MEEKNIKYVNKKQRLSKNIPIFMTQEQRQEEARIIISKLNELQLTIAYEPIINLFIILQNYIKDGERKNINIPFPMISKRIKGILSETVNEKCWVKLEHEKF